MPKPNKSCCPDVRTNPKRNIRSTTNSRKLLAQYAKAIGHPIRLKIIQILKTKNSCICGELVDELPIAQATVSQHLKVLKNSGLIQGTISGPSTCYCIDPEAFNEFKSLVQTL